MSLRNLNVNMSSDKDLFSHDEFQKAVKHNNWEVFTEESLEKYTEEIGKLVEKGESSVLSKEDTARIEKAEKDISKLVKKEVVNNDGKKDTVWVKPVDTDHRPGNEIEYKHPVTGDKHTGSITKVGDDGKISVLSKLKDGTPITRTVESHHIVKTIKEAPKDDSVKTTTQLNKNAFERHQHNMRVQRMGKEASLKHIEAKYGETAASHVRSRHDSESGSAKVVKESEDKK